ncbi:methyltransferase [Candidatus Pelagibacter sp.]|nr:methyltransferase [Candidatus Pelagibacter sp.]MDC0992588.1 methyltransferase [Candidatus Pelagibacter sp.]
MKKINTFNQTIKLINSNKVFEPNLTTQSIIEACNKLKFGKKKKVLDLGSGSGVIGIFLKKKFGKKIDLYLSDYSKHAISVINSNLKINKVTGTAKESDILKGWKNEKFDLIINDISAINSLIAKKHWYNKFIPHDCGKDGLKLSKKFLTSVEQHLEKKGTILMPVISISDHKLITKIIEKNFKYKLLVRKEWPAPKNLIRGRVENFLKKEYIYKKFNMHLCFTKVYQIQKKD